MADTVRPDAVLPWWERAFGREYLEVYAHRDDASAQREVAGLLPKLRHAPGPILDACCGNGRHLAELRRAGLVACGFDLSPQLLHRAAQRRDCVGALARGDVRQPCLAPGFGAVLLLFTAFGYFDDADNAALVQTWAQCLAPGGWLVLDLPDPEAMFRCFQPQSQRLLPSGHAVVENRRREGSRVLKTITYRGETWSESVRIYAPQEIAALAAAAGLSVDATWPSLHSPAQPDGRHVHWLRRGPAAAPLTAG